MKSQGFSRSVQGAPLASGEQGQVGSVIAGERFRGWASFTVVVLVSPANQRGCVWQCSDEWARSRGGKVTRPGSA